MGYRWNLILKAILWSDSNIFFLSFANRKASLWVFRPHRILQKPKHAAMSSGRKITLKSSDGEIFEVDEAVALESQTIKHMIEDDCADSGIPLPNVNSKILSKVIEYCKKHVESLSRRIVLAPLTTTSRLGTANSSKSTRLPYSISFWFVHSTSFSFLAFPWGFVFLPLYLCLPSDCLVNFGVQGFGASQISGKAFQYLIDVCIKLFSVLV